MEVQKPHLTKRTEFETILAHYSPSPEAIKILKATQTAYFVGPTGSGKNTLIFELLKTGKYYNVLSNTTRPRRMAGDRLEHDGEFYWHISEDEFLDGLRAGRYIEAAIIHNQQVSGGCVDEYRNAYEQNKIAITEVEALSGVPTIHSIYPEATYIFILPPTFEEWMDRLKNRGIMTDGELINRLNSAEKEIGSALRSDFYEYIISSDLASNVLTVHQHLISGTPLEVDQIAARAHAEQLLIQIDLLRKTLQA